MAVEAARGTYARKTKGDMDLSVTGVEDVHNTGGNSVLVAILLLLVLLVLLVLVFFAALAVTLGIYIGRLRNALAAARRLILLVLAPRTAHLAVVTVFTLA